MKTDERSEPASEGTVVEQRLQLLQGISIFFTLPDADLRRLARKLRPRRAGARTLILRQGELSNRIFILQSGRCEVRAQWAPGHSVTVAMLSSGDFFGVSALTTDQALAQAASVTATEDCELLELDRAAVDAVLAAGSPARLELVRLVEQRRQGISQLVARAQAVSPEHHGMVVAIYSVKGGSGKTSIAVNLAVSLGMKHRGECVLLDLGLPYNHAALVANLVPTGCVALSQRTGEGDRFEESLLSACLHHPSGAVVLPGTLKVEQSELVTPEVVQRTLDVLEKTFSYVVVDLGVALTEVTLGVLERASRVLLVVTPELPALKDTTELLEVFEKVLKISAGNVSLVLNHPRPRPVVTRADAERVIGRPMEHEIVHDGARFDRAAVTGEVLVAGAPSSPPAKALQRLAGHVAQEYKAHAKAG
ncbi:cyclic nucleotide-binding domain-containing protein [bacterium]|nr:MAG: cyclic nucleotide-binding domain-containing protein [bacterium]